MMKMRVKRFLIIMLTCVCFLTLFNSTKVYASMADEAEYYELGENYTGFVEGGGVYRYYKFNILEKSHVTIYATKHKLNYTMENPLVDVYNSSGEKVISDEDMQWRYNSVKDVYTGQQYRVLRKGTYYIRFYYTGDFSFRVQAEKQISLSKGVISSLKSNNKGQMTIKSQSVEDAVGYRIIVATNEKFTKNKKIIYSPTPINTIRSLKSGHRYYVKVCPYTVYDDGIRIFGQNSLVKTIVIK